MEAEKQEAKKVTPEKQESPKAEETVKSGGSSSKKILILVGLFGLLCVCVLIILAILYLTWFRGATPVGPITPDLLPSITVTTPVVTTTDVVKPKIGTAIQLTQLCKDTATGVSVMLPDSWTCINDLSDVNVLDLQAKSNGSNNLALRIGNLGRDSYCFEGMSPDCTMEPFYSSDKLGVNLFRDNAGGSILGVYNSLTTAGGNDWVEVTYDEIKTQDLIPEEKQLLVSIFESVKTP